jgi:hypothetical protein
MMQSPNTVLLHRKRFALFLKILFRYLEKSGNHALRQQAKIMVCTRTNRLGEKKLSSLIDAIEPRLRDLVGEVHWRRSYYLMLVYLSRMDRTSTISCAANQQVSVATATRRSTRLSKSLPILKVIQIALDWTSRSLPSTFLPPSKSLPLLHSCYLDKHL